LAGGWWPIPVVLLSGEAVVLPLISGCFRLEKNNGRWVDLPPSSVLMPFGQLL
jgi:hypothetical protein